MTGGLRELGVDLLKGGQSERALGVFAEAVRRDSSDYRSRMSAAKAYDRLGERERAVTVLHACAEGLLKRDYLLSAIAACRLALPLAPSERRIYDTLRRIHSRAARQTVGRAQVPPPMPPVSIYEGEVSGEIMTMTGAALSDAAIEVLAAIDQGGQADPQARPPLPLFSELEPEAFIALIEAANYRELNEGDTVCVEQHGGETIYLFVAGKAEVSRLVDGVSKSFAMLTGGSIFGDVSLLTGAPPTATVTCVTDCEVLEMSRAMLNQLTRQHAGVNEALASFARRRIIDNLITTAPVFEAVPKAERTALLQRFGFRAVQAGERLIEEGAHPSGLFLVLAGELLVQKEGLQGEAIALGRLRDGDIAGEIALLKGLRATATVVAERKSAVAFLARDSVESLLNEYPTIQSFLETLSARRLRQLSEAMRPVEIIDADDWVMDV
jgi:CRP-like cAMP-binding protein